ncbi:MAG: nucleoside phosphorylase [Anaerolineae bacterium]
MLAAEYPILEYDPSPVAVINPPRTAAGVDMPERCVLCFFQDVIAKACCPPSATVLHHLRSEMGDHPVYGLEAEGKRVAVLHPGIGAPFAGALTDEMIGLGVRKAIACGGAGVLDRNIAVGHVLVPTSAVRDEGTSYHYLPPSREVAASPEGVAAIERVLAAHGYDWLECKTWTTDAFYRETPAKVQRRREEGCLTVEMEAAAFFAVAQFRGITFAQILYGGDDVSGHEHNSRGWHERVSVRERLFWLAVEACLSL